MKIVNLLAVLLAGILLCALNDVALANKTTKKVKLLHHHKHHSSTTTTHHPLPTKLHHHHKHHRNHHKTRTSKSATPTPTPKPRHPPQPRPQPRPRKTRTTTRTTFSPPTSLSVQPIVPNNESNNSIIDTIPTTTYYSSDPTGLAAPTNEFVPNVSDPNNINPPTKSISGQANQDPDSVQTKEVTPISSNGQFALAIGIAIGGVAALGLAGYAVHRRREASRHDDNNETPPLVNTRWRHQSFLAKVESIVARLPSDSRSSRSSRKSKKSSLSGSTPTLLPAVDHTAIPVASTSQATYGGGGPEYMEEVHLR